MEATVKRRANRLKNGPKQRMKVNIFCTFEQSILCAWGEGLYLLLLYNMCPVPLSKCNKINLNISMSKNVIKLFNLNISMSELFSLRVQHVAKKFSWKGPQKIVGQCHKKRGTNDTCRAWDKIPLKPDYVGHFEIWYAF